MAPIQRTILQMQEVLDAKERPMTTGQLAEALGVSVQTIRNHIPEAIKLGLIQLSKARYGNAYLYESATSRVNHVPYIRRGEETLTLRDVLVELTRDDKNKRWIGDLLNPYKVIATVILRLYTHAASALDEEESTPVALSDVKVLKNALIQLRKALVERISAIDSIINQEELWHPKDMPKELVIKDDELIDSKHLRSILDRVIK